MTDKFKKQIENLKNNIDIKIKNLLENSGELQEFIKFHKANFKAYSIRNSLLIYSQYPTARHVAGFNKWKELGFEIKKGEKAIKILVPLIKKASDSDEKIYGYKYVNVFDISQVQDKDGKAIKTPIIDVELKAKKSTKYSSDMLYKATKEAIEDDCCVFLDKNILALGYTDGKRIFIKDSGKYVDMTGIMVHEYIHLKNHYIGKKRSKNQEEVEAEIGSVIYGAYFNLDIKNLYKYIAIYSEDTDLQECFDMAYKTVEPFIEKVEQRLNNHNENVA